MPVEERSGKCACVHVATAEEVFVSHEHEEVSSTTGRHERNLRRSCEERMGLEPSEV